jgi:hypothetical protein
MIGVNGLSISGKADAQSAARRQPLRRDGGGESGNSSFPMMNKVAETITYGPCLTRYHFSYQIAQGDGCCRFFGGTCAQRNLLTVRNARDTNKKPRRSEALVDNDSVNKLRTTSCSFGAQPTARRCLYQPMPVIQVREWCQFLLPKPPPERQATRQSQPHGQRLWVSLTSVSGCA